MLIVGWAAVMDIQFHKIKNYIVLVGLLGGLLLNITFLKPSLLGMLVPLLLLVLFAVHLMGAGDIKLLCAVGSILCYPNIVSVILYSFVFCGIHILIRSCYNHRLGNLLQELYQDFYFFLIGCIRKEYPKNEKFPMACSIAVATIIVIAKQVFS